MAKGNGGKNTVRTVEQLVRPVVEGMGLRLWDVRFEKEGPDWFLRIFIDRDTPLDTDTCEAVSRAIDPVIDYMEVGSPGLGRRLTRPEHFGPYVGQKIAARLIRPNADGARELEGTLLAFADGDVTLEGPAGPVTFALADASFVKLCDDEDLF